MLEMDRIIGLFPFGFLPTSDVYFSYEIIFPCILVYFYVRLWSTHTKKLNKRRPHNAASVPCWFLQSTGKSFQEFIRTPMSHCSRLVMRTVRLSYPVSWLHGNARLRCSLACFVVSSSQSSCHKSRFDFNW